MQATANLLAGIISLCAQVSFLGKHFLGQKNAFCYESEHRGFPNRMAFASILLEAKAKHPDVLHNLEPTAHAEVPDTSLQSYK